MDGMFGAPTGIMAAQDFMRNIAARKMTESEASLMSTEAQMKQRELSMQDKFMQGMSQIKQQANTPMGMADTVDKMATIAMGAGQVDRASQLSERAAMLRMRMTSMAHNNMLMQQEQLAQSSSRVKLLSQFLQGAGDQASWDRGNALFTRMTGLQSPYAGTQYSPDLAKQAQEQGMSANDLAARNLQAQNIQSLEKARQSAENFRTFRMGLLEREQQLKEQRAAAVNKAGGKAVGSPNKLTMQQATSLITSKMPDLPPEEADAAAFTLASRAEAMVQGNPGLDRATALGMAYQEPAFQSHITSVSKWFGMSKRVGFDRGVGDGPWTQFQQPADTSEDDAE